MKHDRCPSAHETDGPREVERSGSVSSAGFVLKNSKKMQKSEKFQKIPKNSKKLEKYETWKFFLKFQTKPALDTLPLRSTSRGPSVSWSLGHLSCLDIWYMLRTLRAASRCIFQRLALLWRSAWVFRHSSSWWWSRRMQRQILVRCLRLLTKDELYIGEIHHPRAHRELLCAGWDFRWHEMPQWRLPDRWKARVLST